MEGLPDNGEYRHRRHAQFFGGNTRSSAIHVFAPHKKQRISTPAASPAGWISERRAVDQQSDNGAAHLETAARSR